MALPAPAVPLSETPLGEWTVFDTRTAPGLFAYRQSQAIGLLELPDLGGGDLDATQRKEALHHFVSLHRPLAALSLMLGVVALEDFIRDLAARLADNPLCVSHFPELAQLRAQPISRPSDKMFKRLDTDPAGVLDPEVINLNFSRAMGVAPVPTEDFWHLRDLALLRHTVAHHGAVVRQIDLPRFRYFIVKPGRMINPPPDFVRSELEYLFSIGQTIEKAVRRKVFGGVIAALGTGWSKRPPPDVIELVELFGYFGYIETTNVAVGYSEPGSELRRRQNEEAKRIRAVLLQRCVADLTNEHGD